MQSWLQISEQDLFDSSDFFAFIWWRTSLYTRNGETLNSFLVFISKPTPCSFLIVIQFQDGESNNVS